MGLDIKWPTYTHVRLIGPIYSRGPSTIILTYKSKGGIREAPWIGKQDSLWVDVWYMVTRSMLTGLPASPGGLIEVQSTTQKIMRYQPALWEPKEKDAQGQLISSALVGVCSSLDFSFKNLGSFTSKMPTLIAPSWIPRFLACIQRHRISSPFYKVTWLIWSHDLSFPGSPACR